MSHEVIDKQALEAGDLNRYGPTAARQVSTAERRLATKVVDVHAHVAIPAAAEYMRPHFNLLQGALLKQAGELTRSINLAQGEDRKVALSDVADRVRVLDRQGIDIQVIAPFPPQSYYQSPAEHTRHAATLVNDGIAAIVAERPDRFVGLGTVPLNDPDAAPLELERAVRDLKLKGVQILGNVNGVEISDPIFEGFWAKAEELGAVVMIHPYGFESERLSKFYFGNVIGMPLDTTVALHHIIFSGLLERHPDLKILSVHGGGYLPAYSGRIDHAWGARRDSNAGLPKPPTHYLKKIYFDGLVFTAHQLEELVRLYGADHVMLGTDYPFDMAEYFPLDHLMGAELTEAQRRAVAGETAIKLFDLA